MWRQAKSCSVWKMLSKAKLSLIRSLEEKKFRQKEMLFVVEGEKMLLELKQSGWKYKQVFLTRNFEEKYPGFFPDSEQVSEEELKKISFLKSSSSGLALVQFPKKPSLTIHDRGFYLVLDGIRDPGNLGTIIRTCDWFGISDIICSNDTVDFTNPKVIQSSMGSIFRVRLHYLDFQTFFSDLPVQLPIFGADMNGENLFQTKLSQGFLVIGNEADGIRPQTRQWISRLICIPQAGTGVESLNASIATAIICGERFRQSQ